MYMGRELVIWSNCVLLPLSVVETHRAACASPTTTPPFDGDTPWTILGDRTVSARSGGALHPTRSRKPARDQGNGQRCWHRDRRAYRAERERHSGQSSIGDMGCPCTCTRNTGAVLWLLREQGACDFQNSNNDTCYTTQEFPVIKVHESDKYQELFFKTKGMIKYFLRHHADLSWFLKVKRAQVVPRTYSTISGG